MNNIFVLFSLLPLTMYSQGQTYNKYNSEDKGIRFIKAAGWTEVLERAKQENKIIFLDCYTTWCAPCKQMEKNVYQQENVGTFFNKHFVSVKVQMDQTGRDNDYIKSWYKDAREIEDKYSIDAYPTYLFLSPEGKALHRASGAFPTKRFLSIAADALNPETQSYVLADKYDPSKMDTSEMKKVAVSLRLTAPELAGKIALAYFQQLNNQELINKENLELLKKYSSNSAIQDFVQSYINKLSEQQLFQLQNIDLITSFLNSSKERGFLFLYQNHHKVDKIKNKSREYKIWFAKNFIDNIIYKEDIDPYLEKERLEQKEPDWNELKQVIQQKYADEYAERLVIKAKMNWFGQKKNFEAYCKNVVEYMEKYSQELEFDWGWNQYAWSVFQFCNDPILLEKALSWSNSAVMVNPNANWMDTYANLLYKLGRKVQAIQWEEIAAKLDPENKDIQMNLSNMKKGEPTWPLR